MKQGMKDLIKKILKPKHIAAALLFGAPLVGIAMSDTFAQNFAQHLADLLQLVIDALPVDGAAAASPAQ